MENIPLTSFGAKIHFKKLTAESLRKSKSFNLVDGEGEFVAQLVVPVSPFQRMQINSIAEAGNAVRE